MNPIPVLAVLQPSDYAIIAILVLVFGNIGFVRPRVDLRRLERKLDLLLKHQGVPIPPHVSEEVQEMLSDPAKRAQAIKLHAEQAGLDQEEASVDVEAFLANKH